MSESYDLICRRCGEVMNRSEEPLEIHDVVILSECNECEGE